MRALEEVLESPLFGALLGMGGYGVTGGYGNTRGHRWGYGVMGGHLGPPLGRGMALLGTLEIPWGTVGSQWGTVGFGTPTSPPCCVPPPPPPKGVTGAEGGTRRPHVGTRRPPGECGGPHMAHPRPHAFLYVPLVSPPPPQLPVAPFIPV